MYVADSTVQIAGDDGIGPVQQGAWHLSDGFRGRVFSHKEGLWHAFHFFGSETEKFFTPESETKKLWNKILKNPWKKLVERDFAIPHVICDFNTLWAHSMRFSIFGWVFVRFVLWFVVPLHSQNQEKFYCQKIPSEWLMEQEPPPWRHFLKDFPNCERKLSGKDFGVVVCLWDLITEAHIRAALA